MLARKDSAARPLTDALKKAIAMPVDVTPENVMPPPPPGSIDSNIVNRIENLDEITRNFSTKVVERMRSLATQINGFDMAENELAKINAAREAIAMLKEMERNPWLYGGPRSGLVPHIQEFRQKVDKWLKDNKYKTAMPKPEQVISPERMDVTKVDSASSKAPLSETIDRVSIVESPAIVDANGAVIQKAQVQMRTDQRADLLPKRQREYSAIEEKVNTNAQGMAAAFKILREQGNRSVMLDADNAVARRKSSNNPMDNLIAAYAEELIAQIKAEPARVELPPGEAWTAPWRGMFGKIDSDDARSIQRQLEHEMNVKINGDQLKTNIDAGEVEIKFSTHDVKQAKAWIPLAEILALSKDEVYGYVAEEIRRARDTAVASKVKWDAESARIKYLKREWKYTAPAYISDPKAQHEEIVAKLDETFREKRREVARGKHAKNLQDRATQEKVDGTSNKRLVKMKDAVSPFVEKVMSNTRELAFTKSARQIVDGIISASEMENGYMGAVLESAMDIVERQNRQINSNVAQVDPSTLSGYVAIYNKVFGDAFAVYGMAIQAISEDSSGKHLNITVSYLGSAPVDITMESITTLLEKKALDENTLKSYMQAKDISEWRKEHQRDRWANDIDSVAEKAKKQAIEKI